MNKLYVGNLDFDITSDKLKDIFAEIGEVLSANVISDKFSGRSRGFGFVEMGTDALADKAIEALDGKDVNGRALVVNKARPKTE